jgi:hypothetical protein
MAQVGILAGGPMSGRNEKCNLEGDSKMKKKSAMAVLALMGLGLFAAQALSQGGFRVETGKAFDDAVPKSFYLEGNSIPVEKRNSVLAVAPSGARLLAGLIDTTGYSSEVQQKYTGMLITEGSLDVCGRRVGVGSYGFGISRPQSGAGKQEEPARFHLYNQAGHEVGGCEARWDSKVEHPRPLALTPGPGGSARLYLGRNWVELK